VDEVLNQQAKVTKQLNNAMLAEVIEVLLLLAKQNIAVRGRL
jgi:hypothetical protein